MNLLPKVNRFNQNFKRRIGISEKMLAKRLRCSSVSKKSLLFECLTLVYKSGFVGSLDLIKQLKISSQIKNFEFSSPTIVVLKNYFSFVGKIDALFIKKVYNYEFKSIQHFEKFISNVVEKLPRYSIL